MCDYEARFVFIGECGVGKTAFSNKLINGNYSNNHDTTIGIDYFSSNVTINNSTTVKCKIWDTSGLKSFVPLTKSYYKDIAGAILFYDVTNKKTFDNLPFWINELNLRGPSGYEISKLLIGNKIDLPSRQISYQQAKEFAEDNGFMYLEMSVKDDDNVSDKLTTIVKDIYANGEKNMGLKIPTIQTINLEKRRNKESDCCCCIC
jgi:Ras-related protein Rab-2A